MATVGDIVRKRFLKVIALAVFGTAASIFLLYGYSEPRKNVPKAITAQGIPHLTFLQELTTPAQPRSKSLNDTTTKSKNVAHPTLQTNQTTVSKRRLEHLLLTFEPYGRLGNMMFQYAGILGVANFDGRTPFVQSTSVLVRIFNLSHVKSVPDVRSWKHIGEPRFASYESKFESLPEENLVLQAYLQSYKYFSNISSEIKREFRFLTRINEEADKLLHTAVPLGSDRVTIGVHVRRGDKLNNKEMRLGDVTPSKSYFQRAMEWMREKYGRVVFLVTSDDILWSRGNVVGADVVLLPPAAPEVHMAALSKCQHVIMSTGTFGWWSGYFSGGSVVYFNNSMKPGSPKARGFSHDDFFPPHWIGMGD